MLYRQGIDIVLTILEAVQLPRPAVLNGVTQNPIEGVGMAYTFADAKAVDRPQYFEIVGNSGLCHDGWFAATTPVRLPWSRVGTDMDMLATKWGRCNIGKLAAATFPAPRDLPR